MKQELGELRAEQRLKDVELARDAGRHAFARKELATIPKMLLSKDKAVKVDGLKADYDELVRRYEAAKKYLEAIPAELRDDKFLFLCRAARAVEEEVQLDTAGRLETFVALAAQAERDRKAGRNPVHKPEELLAAAVTGWLMGKNAAETRVESAKNFWDARRLVLDYQRADAYRDRQTLLADYARMSQALPFDELDRLITLLPPPTPPAKLPDGPTEMDTGPLPGAKKGMKYVVRLPDEYQAGRSYPLLLVIPPDFVEPDAFLKQFGDLGTKNGYIVVVPKWWDEFKRGYTYKTAEKAKFVGLMRHLRRTYQVDCDRTFAFGFLDGGTIAMDLAATTPDLFAGVVPMSPWPTQTFFNGRAGQWMNFYQTPTYLVVGDMSGEPMRTVRPLLQNWMTKGFPALAVSYKGRGSEWFPAELPDIFDWLGRKKRGPLPLSNGYPAPGDMSGPGYRICREGDDRFNWLKANDIPPGYFLPENFLEPGAELSKYRNPAKLMGVVGEKNTLNIEAVGPASVTVLVGKGLVDIEKPVKVRWNKLPLKDVKIEPKVAVILEDLYERADRQRIVFDKIELKPGK